MNLIAKIEKKFLNCTSMLYIFQLISVICMILTIQIWQIHKFGRVSLSFFFIGFFCSAFSSILAIKKSITGQLLHNSIVCYILEIAALTIFIINEQLIQSYLTEKFFWIVCIPFIMIITIQSLQFIFALWNKHLKINVSKEKLLLGAFVLIIIGIGSQFFNIWPRWDSAAFYFGVKKLNVLNIFQSGKDGLIVCGHPAGAWALLILCFHSITDLSLLNALHLSNIFLTIFIFFLIYLILKNVIALKGSFFYPILAFVFICSPYILGTIADINPERLCIAGLLLFFLGVIKNNYFLCTIACYVVCNSRETGVPIIAGLIFIQLIYELYFARKKKNISFLSILYYLFALIIGSTWLLIFLNNNWSDGMSAEYPLYYNDGTPMFKLGISLSYIGNQLKGIFLTNFTWLYAIIIVIAVFLLVIFSKKLFIKKIIASKLCVLFVAGMIISITELCLFLTHHNYRYYTTSILFIQLLAFLCFYYICSILNVEKWWKNIPMFIIGLFMFLQCHFTIDPVMLASFPILDTGKGKIAVMSWNINHLPGVQFLECANYNYQTAYFDQALDLVYAHLDLSNSRVVIYDGYQWGEWGNTLNSIWGYGYEYMNPPEWGIWNKDGSYRELSCEADNTINPIPIKNQLELAQYLKEYDKLYYLELPWGDKLIHELKKKYSAMSEYTTIEYHGWVLNVYILHADTLYN